MSTKKEFGDFQTPEGLARRSVALVAEIFGTPDLVVEPTAGLGAFLKASAIQWGRKAEYEGYELNTQYVDAARRNLTRFDVRILQRDFFTEDWKRNLSRPGKKRVLVVGNPPWVTNSELGQLGSDNLPTKTNFQGLRGFDARTGKSNFDISEWMLVQLIEALPDDGAIAMLCKTMTARKVLRHFWKTQGGLRDSSLFHIDAKTEFDVAVDACLFFASGKRTSDRLATVYTGLDKASAATPFGLVDGTLVADLDAYRAHKSLGAGSSTHIWRSGVKHDAGSVMEFTRDGRKLVNGLGELVEIEGDYIFPLLKSSDLGNGRTAIRKAVLVTQRHTGDDTSEIRRSAPKTWAYLTRHAGILDDRKSSIYENRPKFSIFGIGPYSFAPWKVAISGLYKDISFVVVPPCDDRPVMVDDTCYFTPCRSQEEAELLFEMLASPAARDFLNSLIFRDSKRPITADLLRRLSLVELARELGKLDELKKAKGEKTKRDLRLFSYPPAPDFGAQESLFDAHAGPG
ncbi:MAG TPA: hypothetical protein VK797_12845 [Tepidisphaeraceae bacterium]|jgi:hypothetical protein|nr:hypothetical protein [Tepidisphaeraceae bacterium]